MANFTAGPRWAGGPPEVHGMTSPGSGPPVIDAQRFLAPENAAGAAVPPEVAAAIAEAASTHGFFQLVNHGSDEALLRRMTAAMHAFFDLDLEAKLAVRRSVDNAMGFAHDELTKQVRDLKEVFDGCRTPRPDLPDDHPANRTVNGCTRWPQGQPEFRAAMTAYLCEMERCSFRLLEAFCLGLGMPPTALHHLFQGQHTSFLRLNFYPPQPQSSPQQEGQQQGQQEDQEEQQQLQGQGQGRQQEGQQQRQQVDAELLGVNHHTDAGFLTILVQDEVPGLQMLGLEGEGEGRWLSVEPIPGALTINVGDQCQIGVLFNDRFKAPVHRVLAPRGQRRRYSAPFFFNPAQDATITPLPQFVDGGHPPLYRPIHWGEFRSKRFAGDYSDQGEELQISHYWLDRRQAAAGVVAS